MANREDVQFRCKLCQFMATSKQQIADHFMDIHAAVEVVGGDSQTEGTTQKSENNTSNLSVDENNDNEVESESSVPLERQEASASKTPSKKKAGFRSNAIRSTISHLVRAAEQASREELTSTTGTCWCIYTKCLS